VGGISPVIAPSGIQGLGGYSLDGFHLSYSGGAFTLSQSTNSKLVLADLTHVATGQWKFSIAGFAKTGFFGAWCNMASLTGVGFGEPVITTVGDFTTFTAIIYSLYFSAGAFAATDAANLQVFYAWK
jgi:hypothetical protein